MTERFQDGFETETYPNHDFSEGGKPLLAVVRELQGRRIDPKEYSDELLVSTLRAYNTAYRVGEPLVSDADYDILVEDLRHREPDHEFLQAVEPEPENTFGKTVQLPVRMLSTQKAYTNEQLQRWCDEVTRVAQLLGVEPTLRVTPKLDGYAAYNDGERLYTRGDGYKGMDITHFADRACLNVCGQGEIVVDKEYFADYLSDKFENTRNVIAAAIKEGELDPDIETGITMGYIEFVPFVLLNGVESSPTELLPALESLWGVLVEGNPSDTDGLVIEVVDEAIKDEMGATNHHYRWQIAYKRNTEYHDIKVTGLTWQTAKTGRITPVVELEPTRISGVTVSRATGHHAGNVINQGIDEGASVRVCRSGQVIPYISEVIEEAPFGLVAHPSNCPSCGAETELNGDNLICPNTTGCVAQKAGMIEHFFKTIGNCDGFGPKVCEQLVSRGTTSVSQIYDMTVTNYRECGFGEKTSHNLVDEINASTSREIEDWRFLAAFGIPNFGPASCEKLLQKYPIALLDELEPEHLQLVEGIGELTAKSFHKAFQQLDQEGSFWVLLVQFKVKHTPIGETTTGKLAGKTICFTGAMQRNRKEMEAEAKKLGATVTSSVSKKTDYLVCGENVGAAKTSAAEKNGVRILSEAEYVELIL